MLAFSVFLLPKLCLLVKQDFSLELEGVLCSLAAPAMCGEGQVAFTNPPAHRRCCPNLGSSGVAGVEGELCAGGLCGPRDGSPPSGTPRHPVRWGEQGVREHMVGRWVWMANGPIDFLMDGVLSAETDGEAEAEGGHREGAAVHSVSVCLGRRGSGGGRVQSSGTSQSMSSPGFPFLTY